MSSNNSNQRLVKNTFMLYCRTFFTMILSIYTSRVTLQALGIEDYGIQNVVGGVVAMFSLLSESLSFSIIRFITFEVGHGNKDKLHDIFCTAVNIQAFISLIVVIAMESIGMWVLNSHLNIPPERLFAANWVFHCSVALFVVYLMCVPYNACIIAHERMGAFAYVGILQSVLNLGIVYLLYISPFDKLISISVLGLIVAIIIRMVYTVYCKRNFEECSYRFSFDRQLSKQMFGFAGWNVITQGADLLKNQGVSILINLYFGVTMNAAQGVAGKIQNIVLKFVNDFGSALHPQITKSYAAGEKQPFYELICRGAKFSFYLLFLMGLPFLFEADMVLRLWLGEIPDESVALFRLSMMIVMVEMLGHTSTTACNATGNIRRLSVLSTCCSILVFPLTWLFFKLGYEVYYTYYVSIAAALVLTLIRVYMVSRLTGFSISMYFKSVIIPVLLVVSTSVCLPLYAKLEFGSGVIQSLTIMTISVLSSCIFIFVFGLTRNERTFILQKCSSLTHKFLRR